MQSIAFGAYGKLLEFHFCHEGVSLEVQHSRLTLGEAAIRITYGKACFKWLSDSNLLLIVIPWCQDFV